MVGEINPKLKGSRNLQKFEMTNLVLGGGTYNDVPVTSRFINITGSGNINSFIYDGTINEFLIYFNSGSNINLGNEAGGASINRIVFPDNTTFNAAQFTMITLERDTVANRWKLGPMSLKAASASSLGYMTAVQADDLAHKVFGLGNGSIGRVAYWADTDEITSNVNLYFDFVNFLLGVQVANPEASIHTRGETLLLAPTEPSAGSATQMAGHIYAPTNPTANENTGGSGYTNGDTIEYQIFDGDSGTYSVVHASTSPLTIGGGTGDVDVSWTQSSGGTVTPTISRIYRQVNSGGFNDYMDFTYPTSSFTDSNSGWTSGSPDPTPQYPDFIADGSSVNFSAYTYLTTILGDIYSSVDFPYMFADDNSGNPYVIAHSVSGGTGDGIRVIDTTDGTHHDEVGNPVNFTEDVTTFISGSVHTPNDIYIPAFKFESHGSTITDFPTGIIQSLDGAYTRVEFQDNTDAVLASIESSATGININMVTYETFVQIANTDVPENSLFLDVSNDTLSYKDSGGTVHTLY